MIILGLILSVAAIGFFCWLLFMLAVFALPFFVGMVAAGLTLGVGQILLTIVRPVWARLLIALIFVAPRRHRRPSRHPWRLETHHAVRNLAARVLSHRRTRGRRHSLHAGRGNGGHRPIQPELPTGLKVFSKLRRRTRAAKTSPPHLRTVGMKALKLGLSGWAPIGR